MLIEFIDRKFTTGNYMLAITPLIFKILSKKQAIEKTFTKTIEVTKIIYCLKMFMTLECAKRNWNRLHNHNRGWEFIQYVYDFFFRSKLTEMVKFIVYLDKITPIPPPWHFSSRHHEGEIITKVTEQAFAYFIKSTIRS